MNRAHKIRRLHGTLRLNKDKKHKVALVSEGSGNFENKTAGSRVLTIKINNELSQRGKTVKVHVENEKEEILRKAQFMDQKFSELLQLVNSK
ncbi:hypothetical protein ABE28_022110 [Peribacillus muralis]|uniref:Uncharacterized protein n=1 Tax=Peribacillus muralis TaxID=264697 RepID=A0A1B3XV08_9BACI|nr:hypothetical protein [Peribacillus muralis]AOH57049.1 hypothetical protein ABE28_022110 [Peribacillus muralis]